MLGQPGVEAFFVKNVTTGCVIVPEILGTTNRITVLEIEQTHRTAFLFVEGGQQRNIVPRFVFVLWDLST